MNTEWLAAWPQVGDAPDYLWQGEDCAFESQCFNTLRPIISMLWFSLPHRLGLPSTAILILHALLMLCSIALSVNFMIRAAGKSKRFFRLQQVLAGIFSTGIHTIFLWPTFFYSLSDTPAALLILCALFLLLSIQRSSAKFRGLSYFFIGLLFGCAEGLRIFYLYPLLAFLALYLTISVLQKKREWRRLYLLSALLPILLQNYATFLYSGEITHMPTSSQMRFWSNMHRGSTYTGYDTLIPEQGYPWFTSPCAVQQGLWASWHKHDWQQLSCLIAGRIYFLLGSYSHQTYFERDDIDLGKISFIGDFESRGKANWKNPYSDGGTLLQPAGRSANNFYQANIEIKLPNAPITLGLTTRSDEASTQLTIRILKSGGEVLAEQLIPMTLQPTRHFLHANIPIADTYVITIGALKTHPAPFMFEFGDFRVTASIAEEDYPVDPKRVRHWSIALFSIQITIIITAIFMIFKNKPEWLAIAALPLLIFLQSPLVIPEQRFIIVTEIFFWLMAIIFLMRHLLKKINENIYKKNKSSCNT